MSNQTIIYNKNAHILQANAISNQAEKRQRMFDKTIDEWKRKVNDVSSELDNSHAECRQNSAELYRLKTQLEESNDVNDSVRRDNKNLADEIHDLSDQLTDGGRSVHELDKARKRLELEKEELQVYINYISIYVFIFNLFIKI